MSVKSHLAAWRSKQPDPETPAAPSKPPASCLVDRCPLPGVYRQSNDSSLCCVHDGEDAHKWPAQTDRILERFDLFDMALRMTNALSGEVPSEKLVNRIVSMGGAEPKPIEGRRMTVHFYGLQLRGAMIAECKGPKEEVPAEGKKAIDSWQKLTAAAQAASVVYATVRRPA